MPSCQRAWPCRLMREKGDVSVMYSYLLIESPTGQRVRRSHLWCLPRQPSHTLQSLLLPHCSVFWHFSCKHNPQEVKNRIVFCCLSSFPYKKVKWAKCRPLDKNCCISQCAVLALHRLLGKVLGHVSLGDRALIVEENPLCLPKALPSLIITNLGIENRFQKVPPVWGGWGERPGLCIWCFREEPPCSELCLCSEFGQKWGRHWLKNQRSSWLSEMKDNWSCSCL